MRSWQHSEDYQNLLADWVLVLAVPQAYITS
jgi:hypothetical protein